jgi:heme-degrading monooxygenase HmoA
MFARLNIFQAKSDKLDEVANNLYNAIPAVKSQKGFRGAYLLTDRKTGKNIAISLWDSEDDANAPEWTSHAQAEIRKSTDLFTAPPVAEGYEVVLQV